MNNIKTYNFNGGLTLVAGMLIPTICTMQIVSPLHELELISVTADWSFRESVTGFYLPDAQNETCNVDLILNGLNTNTFSNVTGFTWAFNRDILIMRKGQTFYGGVIASEWNIQAEPINRDPLINYFHRFSLIIQVREL